MPVRQSDSTPGPGRRTGRRGVCRLFAGAVLIGLAGCGQGPPPVHPPAVSAEEAGRQAVSEYDTNKDGLLDVKELERCPALRDALKGLDKNNDGRLSAAEIADRIRAMQETRVGLLGVSCRVLFNGQPLQGATVTLQPEKFMGPEAKPATGASDAKGTVLLRTEGQNVTGVHPGFYRITVSKKGPGGQELLPGRYNTGTTLGQEISPDGGGQRRNPSITLKLAGG